MSKTANKFSPEVEVRERAVRMVVDGGGQHGLRWQAVMSIAAKISCSAHTLNEWVKKVSRQPRACAEHAVGVHCRAIGPSPMDDYFTYVATWKGFAYMAPRHGHSDQWRSHGSIIDAYARKIVGWRVSTSAHRLRSRSPGTGGT